MRMSCRMGCVLALATMLFAPCAFAAGAASEQEAVALAESAMQKIIVDDIEGAIDLLRPHASIEWGELLGAIKSVAEPYRARPAGGYGEALGYKYVSRESHGDTILRVTFIQKFKRKPLQWDFFFYKPEETWLLWALRFNGAPAVMFNLVAPPSLQHAPQTAAR